MTLSKDRLDYKEVSISEFKNALVNSEVDLPYVDDLRQLMSEPKVRDQKALESAVELFQTAHSTASTAAEADAHPFLVDALRCTLGLSTRQEQLALAAEGGMTLSSEEKALIDRQQVFATAIFCLGWETYGHIVVAGSGISKVSNRPDAVVVGCTPDAEDSVPGSHLHTCVATAAGAVKRSGILESKKELNEAHEALQPFRCCVPVEFKPTVQGIERSPQDELLNNHWAQAISYACHASQLNTIMVDVGATTADRKRLEASVRPVGVLTDGQTAFVFLLIMPSEDQQTLPLLYCKLDLRAVEHCQHLADIILAANHLHSGGVAFRATSVKGNIESNNAGSNGDGSNGDGSNGDGSNGDGSNGDSSNGDGSDGDGSDGGSHEGSHEGSSSSSSSGSGSGSLSGIGSVKSSMDSSRAQQSDMEKLQNGTLLLLPNGQRVHVRWQTFADGAASMQAGLVLTYLAMAQDGQLPANADYLACYAMHSSTEALEASRERLLLEARLLKSMAQRAPGGQLPAGFPTVVGVVEEAVLPGYPFLKATALLLSPVALHRLGSVVEDFQLQERPALAMVLGWRLAEVLAFAHDHLGIAHGDISKNNVAMVEDDSAAFGMTPLLIDWETATPLDNDAGRTWQEGEWPGLGGFWTTTSTSAVYTMALGTVSAESDWESLALLLWEVVEGRAPGDGLSGIELARAKLAALRDVEATGLMPQPWASQAVASAENALPYVDSALGMLNFLANPPRSDHRRPLPPLPTTL